MAGLRLDTPEGAIAERKGRSAVVPGKPESSVLFERIVTTDPAKRMPPAYSNRTLTPDQIATLKKWIEQGGKYSQHWAFVPPVRPSIPQDLDRAWVKDPIDAFVLRRLSAEGLKPSRSAKPAAWLRRASFDLTGLPPTPSDLETLDREIKQLGEDAAYRNAVDRLLASPRYGERMAMDWMDVARYADTHGFNNDSERSMWRWRDWVIQSFNANQPYDRFITEQLAGDLLPNPTLDQRIATGFGRNHVINSEGGIIDEEYRVEYVADRVRTLGMAWMGLTLECAHCHDHKYDPITQKDHYRFFAFFNNVPEIGEDGRVANAVPMISAPTAEQQVRMRELEGLIAKWKPGATNKSVSAVKVTEDPAYRLTCDAVEDFDTAVPLDQDGIAGKACAGLGVRARTAKGKGAPLARREPFTLSLWIQPDAADQDAALLSAIDYSKNMAAVGYGSGTEFRLVGKEIEFVSSQRFTAYSLRVQSDGAQLTSGQWHHVTLTYAGVAATPDAMRVQSSWVRMFVDGREVGTKVLNDGVSLPDKGEKRRITEFRIGWDNRAGSKPFAGKLDEIAFYPRALADAEVVGLFEVHAKQPRPLDAGLELLRKELFALRRNAPTVMVMEELPTPRQSHVLLRGAYNAPGEAVDAGVPEQLLGAWPKGAPKNRLGLAQWLTKPDHPLTSRVVVNRFWQQLFGQGLVKTSDNFGLQGESPSHPELLDLLARDFIDSGWNVKALFKRIVLSSTYRQDSAPSSELATRDPENRLLARGPRFRLPAELIRDQALSISGLLQQRMGGPSVYPYQPADLYKGIVVAADYPGTKYTTSQGDDLYRRSLYTFWKRTVPHPTMTVFDAPDREFCIVRRSTTNTPLQALTLLNDPIFVEAARKLAERAIREAGQSPVAHVFRLATGRSPDDRELEILTKSRDRLQKAYTADEASAKALLTVGASKVDSSISQVQLAAMTGVANMILNLDEVITK
jgi:hypothetical protein